MKIFVTVLLSSVYILRAMSYRRIAILYEGGAEAMDAWVE